MRVNLEIPLGLRNALETGSCVLFLGAGIGRNAIDPEGQPAPTGPELALGLAEEFGVQLDGDPVLTDVAEVVVLRKGRKELQAFLTAILGPLEPDEHLVWLFSLTWRAIVTTNYDRLIQRAYEKVPNPTQTPITFSANADLVDIDQRFQVPIYHVHGSLFEGNDPHVLIGRSDYARFRANRKMLYEMLKTRYATNPILYIGYSHRDSDWQVTFEELREDFAPSTPPESYRIAPETPTLEREILEAERVHTLDGDLGVFEDAVRAALGDIRVEPHTLTALENQIPDDLKEAFRERPASVARLLNSWTYLNAESFQDPPNTSAFLKGDHPNWSLVAQDRQFSRDVEALLMDECLDYATSPSPDVRVVSVLAPAGSGVTTALMSLATSILGELDAPVFFHRRGRPFSEGDLEFVAQAFSGPKFVFLDNAAEAGVRLINTFTRLKELHSTMCIVMGERLNEWRQARLRLRTTEFGIEPLSDGEIDRLLECLGTNSALGQLGDLTPELQVAAIKAKHEKQLLVAMREATEGRAFDAIIEDEYRNIGSDMGRHLYAAVSGFYRVRAYARDQVLASILDTDLATMYKQAAEETEGVVEFEPIGDADDTYAARARHHVIAEIVWERCLESSERSSIMLRAIKALNLHYGTDSKAFESFVRSDESVDSIGSFEERVRFFEEAAGKSPHDPYVRQHYARMLRRERRFDLALDQIAEGLKLSPDLRVLHHTKGVVLADMALSAESVEVARRRLAQAQDAFETGIRMSPRDEYGYQSLAEMYLGWAKKAPTEEESIDYLRRCEETITQGLRVVRVREGLWVVSSQVAKWLGDHPTAQSALLEAVSSTPGGVIGRYLLGKLYLEQGTPERTLEILQPVLEHEPEQVRSCLLYARAQYALRASYAQCIATLRLCSPHGLRYPMYIATLGGFLFMNGEFTEADELFAQSRRRGFAFREIARVSFIAMDESRERLVVKGRVSQVNAGYAFVAVDGYPDFFCPGSKFGSLLMRRGLAVEFTPGFSARGPQTMDIREAE